MIIAASATFGNVIVATGSLVLLLLLLKKFAWKNVSEILQKRAEKISKDIDEAEQANFKSKELLQKRQEQLADTKEEATKIMATAKESGERSKQNILQEAQSEVVRLKAKASSDIEQEKENALVGVRGEVAEISLQLAKKLIGKEIDQTTHQELIDEYLTKLGK